jgi:benzodiazapine receptor
MHRTPAYLTAVTTVGVTALAGSAGTDVNSRWYRRLDKPPWQPPGPVFGTVWTVLYALLAMAGGRALSHGASRRHVRAFGLNLVLNAGWSWVFFRAHRPVLAVVESAALTVSTVDLARRTWPLDRVAGVSLLPYAAWVTGATVLSGDLARRNSGSGRRRAVPGT